MSAWTVKTNLASVNCKLSDELNREGVRMTLSKRRMKKC